MSDERQEQGTTDADEIRRRVAESRNVRADAGEEGIAVSGSAHIRNAVTIDPRYPKLAASIAHDHDHVRWANASLLALLDESDECAALRFKMGALLTATANALKGEPEPRQSHSWHDLADVAATLLSENARLTEALRVATTPNLVSLNDCQSYEETDFDDLMEDIPPNDVRELDWANRTLDGWWAAHVVTEWDDDFEGVAESCIELFPSEAEARAAVAVLPKPAAEPTP